MRGGLPAVEKASIQAASEMNAALRRHREALCITRDRRRLEARLSTELDEIGVEPRKKAM